MENDNWILELEGKPDFEMAMKRIYAWYNQSIIDRVPIRFSAHNAEYIQHEYKGKKWNSLKERWFDAEYQVDYFIRSIENQRFIAETFPVFWPNLGPEVYSAFYGSELQYMEVTSYSIPLIKDWSQMALLKINRGNEYFRKIDELTDIALAKAPGKFMVGYTDIHPSVDCAAAWRDPQQFCTDMLMYPEEVKELIRIASADFQEVYDYYDRKLKAHNQLSVTWMGIPSFGKMHIPSCDFSAMISSEDFEEFCFNSLKEEVKPMTHNIYHVDGKGVARHLDFILSVKEINAIQWVQGMGDDTPIMQWIPLIKKIQAAGKSLVIDLQPEELDDFMRSVRPEGILLCIAVDQSTQPEIIKRVEKWK